MSDEWDSRASEQQAGLDIDAIWDFSDPAGTEAKFMALRERLGRKEDHAKLMELDTQLARAQGLQGRFAHALATLETMHERLEPDERRPAIRYELEMGRVLRSSGSPTGARDYFERAVKLAKEAGEEALEIDAWHMIALVEPSPAQRIHINMDALERASAASDPRARRWRGSLWNNTGMDFHELGELDWAMEAFEASLAAWEEDYPERTRIARWMIGWTLRLQGKLPEALAAQEALERDYADDPGAGYVEEELGEIHLAWPGDDAWKHRALARKYFARAHEMLSANGEIDHDPERLARMKRLAEGGVE